MKLLIKSEKIVSDKHTYTIKCDTVKNMLKKNACIDKGLLFEFKIY
ncbi:MAG TPA: hypothetical protein P5509_07035 [Bacteroidales bacterium]|nr:hypothetical protein [Bacteroidales bacterium]